jgi:hypothetical protein
MDPLVLETLRWLVAIEAYKLNHSIDNGRTWHPMEFHNFKLAGSMFWDQTILRIEELAELGLAEIVEVAPNSYRARATPRGVAHFDSILLSS